MTHPLPYVPLLMADSMWLGESSGELLAASRPRTGLAHAGVWGGAAPCLDGKVEGWEEKIF